MAAADEPAEPARRGSRDLELDSTESIALDVQAIAESVRKTGRLVVVSEGVRAGGFASEVVARIVDEAWHALHTAPVRVTAKDTPIPYAATLEREVLPQVEDVLAGIKQVMQKVPA